MTQDAIKSVALPISPLAEQRAIAAHLDGRMAAIADYERKAPPVGEYWARLAADAAAGRVDARWRFNCGKFR